MTTALRIQCLTAWAILACLAFSSEARAAEPGSIYVQRLLGPSATAPMRDTSARCEMGDSTICWNLANSFFRFAQISAPGGSCALRSCDDPAASYTDLGCALSRYACDGASALIFNAEHVLCARLPHEYYVTPLCVFLCLGIADVGVCVCVCVCVWCRDGRVWRRRHIGHTLRAERMHGADVGRSL